MYDKLCGSVHGLESRGVEAFGEVESLAIGFHKGVALGRQEDQPELKNRHG